MESNHNIMGTITLTGMTTSSSSSDDEGDDDISSQPAANNSPTESTLGAVGQLPFIRLKDTSVLIDTSQSTAKQANKTDWHILVSGIFSQPGAKDKPEAQVSQPSPTAPNHASSSSMQALTRTDRVPPILISAEATSTISSQNVTEPSLQKETTQNQSSDISKSGSESSTHNSRSSASSPLPVSRTVKLDSKRSLSEFVRSDAAIMPAELFVSGQEELKMIFHLFVDTSMTAKLYRILTLVSGRPFKVFLSNQASKELHAVPRNDWSAAVLKFLPDKEKPEKALIRLPSKDISADFAETSTDLHKLVRNGRAALVAAHTVVTELNGSMLEKIGKPFISYAVDESGMVMAIDLEKLTSSYAVPLFGFLTHARDLDAAVRKRCVGHLGLALHHFGVNHIDAELIERALFNCSKNCLESYQKGWEGYVKRLAPKKRQLHRSDVETTVEVSDVGEASVSSDPHPGERSKNSSERASQCDYKARPDTGSYKDDHRISKGGKETLEIERTSAENINPDDKEPRRVSVITEHLETSEKIDVTSFPSLADVTSLPSLVGKTSSKLQSELSQKIYESYLGFCKKRNQGQYHKALLEKFLVTDPRTCDAAWINVFLATTKRSSRASPEVLAEVVSMIAASRDKQVSGDAIDKLLTRFKITTLPSTPSEESAAALGTSKEAAAETAPRPTVAEPKNCFICSPCKQEFASISSMTNHLKQHFPSTNVVSCKFCRVSCQFPVGNINTIEGRLHLHSVSPAHLHNRWQQSSSTKTLRPATFGGHNNPDGDLSCDACCKKVQDLEKHLNSKQHKDFVVIIDDFSSHCKVRNVSPVTCFVDDVKFYLESAYIKTTRKMLPVSFFQVVGALNKIHDSDPVTGNDIGSDPTIEDHINDLFSTSRLKRIPEFVCFSCLEFGEDLEKISAHCQLSKHLKAVEERGHGPSLFCEPCGVLFDSLQRMTKHFFTKSHLTARRVLITSPETRQLPSESFYPIDSENYSDSNFDHPVVLAARKFVDFCDENRISPAECSNPDLENFIKSVSANDVISFLKCVDLFHDAINGQAASDVIKAFIQKQAASAGPPPSTKVAMAGAKRKRLSDSEDKISKMSLSIDKVDKGNIYTGDLRYRQPDSFGDIADEEKVVTSGEDAFERPKRLSEAAKNDGNVICSFNEEEVYDSSDTGGGDSSPSSKVKKCSVALEDLALSLIYGHCVRKQFKSYVRYVNNVGDPKNIVWSFGYAKKCRKTNCSYSTESGIKLLRHYRLCHLASQQHS